MWGSFHEQHSVRLMAWSDHIVLGSTPQGGAPLYDVMFSESKRAVAGPACSGSITVASPTTKSPPPAERAWLGASTAPQERAGGAAVAAGSGARASRSGVNGAPCLRADRA